MAGPLDEINNNIKNINQQATKKLLVARASEVEGYGKSFKKSLEVGEALKDPMTYARMIPPVGTAKAVVDAPGLFKKAWKTGSAFLSLPARVGIHTAAQDPYLATQMFSGPVSGFNPVTSQSYAVATALGAPVPTTKEATPTRPARIRGTPFEEPEGWRPKSGLPHVPEYVDQEVNVPAGVAKGWQEHYPYMLRGLGEFQNIIQGDEVSRNTLKIMTDKSLGFNEKNKLLQEQYDSLPESEKLIYDHANPGQWAVDILGGKALSKSGPLWKGLGKVTGINKLIRKWKMRGETIYSPESPGPEAVEERLESIHDIAILKSPKIKTEIPQVIQPGQERLAEFRKTIPEKVDVSPEAMNNWRAEVGDKYGISADTARVKMKEAGGIIAEEIPEQKIFNDWATEFTTIQRIHNKDFKEKAIGISFPWSNKWKVIQARALDKPFMTHTLEDIEDGYVVLMHGAREEYDEFGRMHILTSGEGRIGAGVYTGNHPFIARQYAGLFTRHKYSPKSNVRMFGVDPMPRNSIFDLNGEIIPGSRNYKAIDLLKKNMQEGTDGVSAQHWTEAVNEVLMEGPGGQGWTAGRITLSKNTLQETDTTWFAFDNLDDFANNNPIWVQLPPEWLFDDMWDTAVKLGHVDATTPKVYPMMLDDVRGTFGGWNPLRPLQGWDVRDILLPEIKRNLEVKGYIFKPYLLEQYKGQDEIPVPKGPWGEQADELNEMMATPPPANEIPELVPAKEPGIIGKPRWQDPKEVLQPSPDSEIFEAERGGLGYVAQYMGEDSMWSNDFLRASGYQAIHHFQRVRDAAHPIAYQEGAENLPYIHNVLARGLKEKGQLIEHALYAFSRKMAIDDLHPKGTVPEKDIEQVQMAYARGDYDDVWLLDIPKKYLKEDRPLEHLRLLFEDNPNLIPVRPNNKIPGVTMEEGLHRQIFDIEDDMNHGLWKSEILDEGLFPVDEMYTDDSGRVIMFIGKLFDDEGNILAFAQDPKSFGFSYLNKAIARTQEELIEAHFKALPETLDLIQARELASKRAINIDPIGVDKKTTQLEPKVDLSKGVPLDTLPPPGRTIPPAAIAVGAGAGVGTGLGAGVHALSQREKPIPPPQPISPIPPVETLGDSEFAPKPDPTRIQEAALPWGQIGKGIARVGKEAIKKVWDPSEFVTTLQKVGKGEKFGKDLDESLKVKPELVKKDSSWLSGKVRMPWMGKVLSWMDESELLPISVPKGIKEADIFQRAPVSKREQFNENLIAYLTDPDGWGKLHPDGRPMWQHVREDIQATGYQDASELVDVIREMAEEVNELQLGRLAEVQKIRSAVTPELAQAGAGARKIPRGERAEAISISQRKAAARAGEAFEETTTAQMPKSATQILDEIIERRGMSGRTSGAKTQEFILGDLYLAMREINEDLFEYSQRHILPGYDIPNQFGDTIKGPWDLFNYSENVGAMFNPTKALLPGTYTLNMMQSIFGPVVTEPLRIARIKAQHTYLRSIANKLPESIRKSFVELLDTIQKADTETEGWNALKAFKKFGADPASSAYIGIVRHSPTDWLTDLFGAGKTVYSTFDNSIPLIQSYPLLTENPKIWFNAWKVSARAWLPGGGGSVDETLEAIRRDPDYNIGARLGLIIPRRGTGQDIEAAELLKTPIGRLFRHLWPTAAQAENAAIGFLSSARFNYFKQQYAWELALKRKTNGVDAVLTDKEIKDIINWTHMITGRGPLNYIGVTEKATLEGKGRMAQAIMNAVFFSPRKFSADLTYVPALFKRMQQGKFSGSPQEMQFARMMAQQNVRGAIVMFYRGLIFLKTIAFLHGLREMTGLDRGVEPVFDWLEDNLDASFKPGGRFMKFRIGKTWDSPFGSQAPMMSASYEMAFKEKYSTSGEKIATNYMDTIWRLGRGRLSPVTGETLSYILGRGWGGEVYDFKKDIKKPGLRGWLKGQKIDRSSFWFRHMSSISMETFFDIWDTSVVQKELTNDIKEELGLPIDKPTPKNFWEFLKTNPDDAAIAAVSAIAGFHGRGQTYQQPEETISEATGVPVEDLPSRALNVGEKVIREKEYERTGVVRGTEFDEIKRERDAAINQIQYNVVEYAGQNKTVMDWFNTYGSATNMPMSLKTKVGRIFFDVTQEYRYKFQAEIEKREGKPEGLMYREPDLEARREGMDFKNKALSIWYEQAARASSINDYTQKLENFVKGIENEKTLSKEEQNEVINFIYGSAYPYDIPEWLYAFLPPTTRAKIDRTRKISEFTIDKARDNKVDNNR